MSAGQPKSRNVKLEDQVEGHDSDQPSEEFLSIFDKLDGTISGELIEKAWKQYDTIGQQIILEGAQKPWMACAFYTTVWQAAPLGAQEPAFKYSVSKLLNICNLSVLEFFEKLNKWAEMILAKGRLLEHINRVQANLAVSTVVYKKFLPIFRRVFVNHSDKTSAKSRANQIQGAINTAHVFEFSWLMFIALKKQFAGSVDDLMNSFHLLLCVVELVFVALKDLKLNSLINADFANTLTTKDETALESLCEMFEGVVLDAKHFQVHWLAPKLRKLTEDSVIVGSTKMGGLLTDINTNKKAFDSLYEEKMLKKSEVDERIFLSAATTNMDTVFNEALDATTITMLRRSNPNDASWAIDAELLLRMSTQNCLEKLNSQRNVQSQPSSKSYVITPEQFCPTTPITVSAHRSQKMAELLVEDFKNNENFDRLLAQCRDNPKTFIAERVALLEERLFLRVEQEKTAKGGGYDSNFSTTIKQRKENVEALFYRLLYQVISYDRERGANGGVESTEDLSTILYKVDFIGSLWICALELVVFTYASEREFPWSAEVAQVAPVNFYKIIELIVRAEPDLSREMVKHLNKVEERVLEELAWSMDSPLWGALAKHASEGVPSSRALSLSSYDSYGAAQPYSLASRYSTSPMKPYERGQGAVKRHRLDYDDEYDTMEEDQREELLDNAGIPPRSKRPATDDYNVDTQQQQEFTQGVQALPSSITVFFRKVYYLVAVRLTDLCDRIRMEETGRQKVWTLFEHLLRKETLLMVGRHLDQNLMCCLYIVSKVCGLETSFHDIMYHYRHQPQAVSRVYRRVLIDPSVSPATVHLSDDGASRDSVSSVGVGGNKLRSSSALPAPDMASAPPTPEPHNLDYADLIKYYNRVFVAKVEDFVKQFNPTNSESKENNAMLLPMPKVYCNSLSPRRLVNDQINVLPISSFPAMIGRPTRYNFNRSPSKDLKSINQMVRSSHIASPRASHIY